jgi:uncharacterized repeat protein (TIGR03803 family)
MKYLVAAALAVLAAVLSPAAQASTYTAVYSFCPTAGCPDGAGAWSPPVGDGSGHYYGTSAGSGPHGGTIYEFTLKGKTSTFKLLYTFCTQKKCPDGDAPHGSLVRDTKGNLYGTTQLGGGSQEGVIFELSPKGGQWTYTQLHSFCQEKQCTDGGNPVFVTLTYQGAQSGAPYDGTSPLFGATAGDGSKAPAVVFSLTPSGKKWVYGVVYKFCSQANCADGQKPYSAPIVDGSGNLFGTTTNGGALGFGAVYELQPQGKNYVQSVIYSFCAQQFCADGSGPIGAPLVDDNGNIFGTANAGGKGGEGAAFELVRNGASWKYTKLHDFCLEPNCTDGSGPFGGLAFGPGGTLIGATFLGGDANRGLIFKIGGAKPTTFKRLFSLDGALTPGALPLSGPVPISATTFIGVTAAGGDADEGVIYRLTP